MATEKQIRANRANAQRSTGPKTVDGKARACSNSTKHGLTARKVLLPEESPGEFSEFRALVLQDLRVKGPTQGEIGEQIVQAMWRARRIARFERDIIVYMEYREAPEHDLDHLQIDLKARARLLYDQDILGSDDAEDDTLASEDAEAAHTRSSSDEPPAESEALPGDTEEGVGVEPLEDASRFAPRNNKSDVASQDAPRPVLVRGRSVLSLFQNQDLFSKLARYDAHLAREIERKLALLAKIQDREERSHAATASPDEAVPAAPSLRVYSRTS